MHGLSLPQPDNVIQDDVWKKLNVDSKQRAIELLAMMAIRLLTQNVTNDDKEVIHD